MKLNVGFGLKMLKYLLPILTLLLFYNSFQCGVLMLNFLFVLTLMMMPMLVGPVCRNRVLMGDELGVGMIILSL